METVATAPTLELREVRDGDGPALAALAAVSADTGAVRFSPRWAHDPIAVARVTRPSLVWVVAESGGELAGAAQVSFGECELEGELRPYALLSSLMVHPSHRRRGIARALTEWRLERIEERLGADGVVVANIQSANEGSFANARSWATQVLGAIASPAIKPRTSEPRARVELRAPDGAEWDAAAAGLARFEAGWNLRVPETGASLEEWTSLAPFGERVRRYVVAVHRGEVVAGAGIVDTSRLQWLHVEHVPPLHRALNVVLRIIPRDGTLRPLSVSRLWHAPGHEDAGRAVWEHARFLAHASASAVIPSLDVRGPLRRVVPLRPWTPQAVTTVAVRSPVPLSEDRLLAPLL